MSRKSELLARPHALKELGRRWVYCTSMHVHAFSCIAHVCAHVCVVAHVYYTLCGYRSFHTLHTCTFLSCVVCKTCVHLCAVCTHTFVLVWICESQCVLCVCMLQYICANSVCPCVQTCASFCSPLSQAQLWLRV